MTRQIAGCKRKFLLVSEVGITENQEFLPTPTITTRFHVAE